jgi:hypothetical protein
MLSGRNWRTEGASNESGIHHQEIREQISKLNQVLHLLESGKKVKGRRKMSAAGDWFPT